MIKIIIIKRVFSKSKSIDLDVCSLRNTKLKILTLIQKSRCARLSLFHMLCMCLNCWVWTLISSMILILQITIATSSSGRNLLKKLILLISIDFSHYDALTHGLVAVSSSMLRTSCWILGVVGKIDGAWRNPSRVQDLLLRHIWIHIWLPISSIVANKVVTDINRRWIDIVDIMIWLHWVGNSGIEAAYLRGASSRSATSWSRILNWRWGSSIVWLLSLRFLIGCTFAQIVIALTNLFQTFISIALWWLSRCIRLGRYAGS